MRVTIEAETDAEQQAMPDPVVRAGLVEFALIGTRYEGDVIPTPVRHMHGDLTSLCERIAGSLKLLELEVYASRFHRA